MPSLVNVRFRVRQLSCLQNDRRHSNPDFQINPDPDVCRICPEMLWMHYLVGVSHLIRQVWYKSAVDCTKLMSKKSPIPQR